MNKSNDYHDYLIKSLKDPARALGYLNAALDDGDQRVFLLCLRNVVEAHGISRLARRTHISREHFYRMFSNGGNPQWDTLCKVMNQIGFRLTVHLKTSLPDAA